MSRASYPRHSDYKEISKNPAKKLRQTISSESAKREFSNERLHRRDTMATSKPVRRILEKKDVGNIRCPIGKKCEYTRGLIKKMQKIQRKLKQKLLQIIHRFTKAALDQEKSQISKA